VAWLVHTESMADPETRLDWGDRGLLGDLPPTTRTRVLVVGTHEWAIEQAASAVRAAGLQVLRCHEPGQPAFPCNALIEGRTCPLDAGFDVVLTARARPLATLAQSEFGVVCALHHGMPLVVAGVAPERPLGPWASETLKQGEDVAVACEAAASRAEADRRATAQVATGSSRQSTLG
jgi:hypothetical protein